MCWAAGQCASCTTSRTCASTWAKRCWCRPSIRCSSTSSSRTRSRSTWTRWRTPSGSWSAASWSTSRRPASTRATPRARCRRTRSATGRCASSARRPARWRGGPAMKSTGEVMGIDRDFRKAYLKAQIAAGETLPASGTVFISVKNRDRRQVTSLAKRLADMGFTLVATDGTARVLARHGMPVEVIHKVGEGYRPNVIDLLESGRIAAVFNTPEDGRARKDSAVLRRTAVAQNVAYYTTVDGIQAAIGAIEALLKGEHRVRSLQEYHAGLD